MSTPQDWQYGDITSPFGGSGVPYGSVPSTSQPPVGGWGDYWGGAPWGVYQWAGGPPPGVSAGGSTGGGGIGGAQTLTAVRMGLGSASLVGLLQGDVSIVQQLETFVNGSGIPFTVVERLITKQRASMMFAGAGLPLVSFVSGAQTATGIGFAFGGSGPAYSAGLSGFLNSVEYTFGERAIATCKVAYEAQGGTLSPRGGAGGASAPKSGLPIGLVKMPVAPGSLLQGSVTASAAATFNEQWAGVPIALQQRDAIVVTASLRASFAIFPGLDPTLGGASDATFIHNSGFTVTIQNAMLVSTNTRFSRGIAVLDCEWQGTGLVASG